MEVDASIPADTHQATDSYNHHSFTGLKMEMLDECGGAESTSVCLLCPPTQCAVWEADTQHLVYFNPWICEVLSSPFTPRTEWLTHTCTQSDSCKHEGNTTRRMSSSKWNNTAFNQVQTPHFLSRLAICHSLVYHVSCIMDWIGFLVSCVLLFPQFLLFLFKKTNMIMYISFIVIIHMLNS